MMARRSETRGPLPPCGGGDRGTGAVGVETHATDRSVDGTSFNTPIILELRAKSSFNVAFCADGPLSPVSSPTRGEGNANRAAS